MSKQWYLYFDGATEPVNPGGIASWGFSLTQYGQAEIVGFDVIGVGEGMTNNVAEYTGIIEGLLMAQKRLGALDSLMVRGDSKLVINQVKGSWKVKAENLKEFHKTATELIGSLVARDITVELEWVPRENNERADELSHKAFDKYCSKHKLSFEPCDCGGTYILRKNKNGSRFYGCNRYPKCKNTRPYDGGNGDTVVIEDFLDSAGKKLGRKRATCKKCGDSLFAVYYMKGRIEVKCDNCSEPFMEV